MDGMGIGISFGVLSSSGCHGFLSNSTQLDVRPIRHPSQRHRRKVVQDISTTKPKAGPLDAHRNVEWSIGIFLGAQKPARTLAAMLGNPPLLGGSSHLVSGY